MSFASSLVSQLRRRILDDRVGRVAFRLACVDPSANDCMAQIIEHTLTLNVYGGRTAQNLSLDLTSTTYGTVRALIEYLQAQPGYKVAAEPNFAPDHPSVDLEVVGSMSILNTAATFRHHLFSDAELLEVLDDACSRHNVGYTPQTLPANESGFVCMIAHADVCRRLAGDAAKRRNVEMSADQLLQLADQLERTYSADVRRQQRAIPVAKVTSDEVQQGDVVVGTFSKRSLRTGYHTPSSNPGAPQTPVLDEPDPDDVEDTRVTLRWRRNSDARFLAVELWRDTQQDIQRPLDVSNAYERPSALRLTARKVTTAKLVFCAVGSNLGGSVNFATSSTHAGQLSTAFTDIGSGDQPAGQPVLAGKYSAPPLEPETTYYYRLFVVSINREMIGGNVVAVTTKPLRSILDSANTTTEAFAGGEVVIRGLRLSSTMSVFIGGKAASFTLIDSTHAVAVMPTFTNPAALNTRYDLVVKSSSGLIDVIAGGILYKGTAP